MPGTSRVDLELAGNIFECLCEYHRANPAKLHDWFELGRFLEQLKAEHPREYAKAEKVYYLQVAPRKERMKWQNKTRSQKS